VAVHKGKYQVRKKRVARGEISTRATLAAMAVVIGRGVAMVAAGVFFITAFPVFAYHPSHGGGEASGGGASYDAFLPIVIAAVVLMVGAVLWGRKKPKRKPKARPAAQPKARVKSKPKSKPKRVKRTKRRR
jgi:hypothetical protein